PTELSCQQHLLLYPLRPPPSSTRFPYTTLFRSLNAQQVQDTGAGSHADNGGNAACFGFFTKLEHFNRGLPVIEDITVMLTFLNRSEEHTSELQSRFDLVCRLLLEKKN